MYNYSTHMLGAQSFSQIFVGCTDVFCWTAMTHRGFMLYNWLLTN